MKPSCCMPRGSRHSEVSAAVDRGRSDRRYSAHQSRCRSGISARRQARMTDPTVRPTVIEFSEAAASPMTTPSAPAIFTTEDSRAIETGEQPSIAGAAAAEPVRRNRPFKVALIGIGVLVVGLPHSMPRNGSGISLIAAWWSAVSLLRSSRRVCWGWAIGWYRSFVPLPRSRASNVFKPDWRSRQARTPNPFLMKATSPAD